MIVSFVDHVLVTFDLSFCLQIFTDLVVALVNLLTFVCEFENFRIQLVLGGLI